MNRRPIRRRGYNLSDEEFKLQLMERRILQRKARQAQQTQLKQTGYRKKQRR